MSDSFEKIAEDALMDEYSYCEEHSIDFGEDADPAECSMRRDLIGRMKAVAARGCSEELREAAEKEGQLWQSTAKGKWRSKLFKS